MSPGMWIDPYRSRLSQHTGPSKCVQTSAHSLPNNSMKFTAARLHAPASAPWAPPWAQMAWNCHRGPSNTPDSDFLSPTALLQSRFWPSEIESPNRHHPENIVCRQERRDARHPPAAESQHIETLHPDDPMWMLCITIWPAAGAAHGVDGARASDLLDNKNRAQLRAHALAGSTAVGRAAEGSSEEGRLMWSARRAGRCTVHVSEMSVASSSEPNAGRGAPKAVPAQLPSRS